MKRYAIITSITDTYFNKRFDRVTYEIDSDSLESDKKWTEAHLKRFGSPGDSYRVVELTPVILMGYVGFGFVDSGWRESRIWVLSDTVKDIRSYLCSTEVIRFMWNGKEYRT